MTSIHSHSLYLPVKSTVFYRRVTVAIGIILLTLLTLAGCNDADLSEKVKVKVDDTIKSVADNAHLDIPQVINIEENIIITKSGLTLDNQKIDANIVGNSTGVCLRLDNNKLPYQHLSEVDDWTNRINLKAIVLLENNQSILLTKSLSGLIASSTEDRIKPSDYLNVCLSNHQITHSLIGQKIKEITITTDENLSIENIQWWSS